MFNMTATTPIKWDVDWVGSIPDNSKEGIAGRITFFC